MNFHVGPVQYRLVISDRSVFDAEGNELEGAAVEARRLLILSRIVEPERREEVALHEFVHAWAFHVPQPSTEEERCQLTALIARQFHDDVERQGGREALRQLPVQRVPHLGKPSAKINPADVAREASLMSDRVPCGTCDAPVMCGSIEHGEPELHAETGQLRLERWMRCEACGSLQIWQERCTADGTPLGEFVSNPRPRILNGAEASAWLAERREMASGAATV